MGRRTGLVIECPVGLIELAAHVADRSRARMLLDLLDGTARPLTHLAQADLESRAEDSAPRLVHDEPTISR